MTLLRHTQNDGWARDWRRGDGLRHALVAKEVGRSVSAIAHLVTAMQKRFVIEARRRTPKPVKGGGGEAAEYRILPQQHWMARNPAAKPRVTLPSLRMRARNGAVRMTFPGQKIAELPGQPEITFGVSGRPVATVKGADVGSVRIPEGAKVDIADGIELLNENSGKRLVDVFAAEKEPMLPAAEVSKTKKSPLSSTAEVPAAVPKRETEPLLPTAEVENGRNGEGKGLLLPAAEVESTIYCRGGYVKVWWPGKPSRLTTAGEAERVPGMAPDEAANFFAIKGFRAQAFCDDPKQISARNAALELDGPPTGTWERVLGRLKKRVNAHSFGTWFGPTREAGTLGGKIVVLVPTPIFSKRMKQTYGDFIDGALVEIGCRNAQLEFVAREETEVKEFPATALAGKQHQSQPQRRIA